MSIGTFVSEVSSDIVYCIKVRPRIQVLTAPRESATVGCGPVEISAGTCEPKGEPVEIKSGGLMKLYHIGPEPIS